MNSSPTLSVVVTALNEKKNVSPFLERLRGFLETQKISHEVLFVDDGSTDGTFTEAEKWRHWQNLKIYRLDKNHGFGGAIKQVFKNMTGEWYAWLPCDLEIPPEEILKPYRLRENHDIVITHFSSGLESRTLGRRFFSFLFTRILNFSFGQNLPYYNGLSLIKRSLMAPDQVRSNGFFFNAELLVRTLSKSNKVATVPIRWSPRQAEKAKAIKLKVFKDVISCYLKMLWEEKLRDRKSSQ